MTVHNPRPDELPEIDDDLPDLDSLLEGSPADRRMTDRELKQWNSNVHSRIEDDLDSLLAEAAQPRAQWETIAAVVLIHEQHCIACQQTSRISQGWFTAQKHTSDKFANRLLAGRPIGSLPLRVERHKMPDVDICANCAEGQIMIEQAMASEGRH